ncbi:hypothetical protein GNY06_05095 [Elizabethkingia argentiflava]|uniref:Phage tail tape measure protein domain-containing protein n=1 Tax=Elizabethkingia argenteiflava TaxID=2681556 RepID=A0A845PSH8_9FLAO|nr:phage tail tape measure protein [Elizabethkingia argenteiflava]NAW50784.1 hypothetical protein [Elizabethkingia argenteiflava]
MSDELAIILTKRSIDELDALERKLDVLYPKFNEIVMVVEKLNLAFGAGKPKAFSEASKGIESLLTKVNKLQKELEDSNKRLANAEVTVARVQQLRVKTQLEVAKVSVQEARANEINQKALTQEAKARGANADAARKEAMAQIAANRAKEQGEKRIKNAASAYFELNKQTRTAKEKAKDLNAQIFFLNEALEKGEISQRAYNLQIKEVAKDYKKAHEEAKKYDAAIKNIDANEGDKQRNVGNYPRGKFFGNLNSNFTQLAAGFIGFQGVSSIIDNMAELSDQTATLEIELGKAKGGAQGLVNELAKLDTRTQLTELVNISNIAARAGVDENNLVGVTKAVDQIRIAFGQDFGDVEHGTESLIKLINIFEGEGNVTEENLLRMGNAVRTIANESVASVPFLNDFSKRMAGLKGISDISLPAVLGLASGFEQFGQTAEVSSTALVKIIPKLATDTEKFAKIAGMTKQSFEELLNSKPEEAFIKISEALVKGKGDIQSISKAFSDSELGKGRVASILGTAGENADAFRKAIGSAKEAYDDTSNIIDAFNAKNETFAAKLDKIKKRFADLSNSQGFQRLVTAISNGLLMIIKLITSIPFSVVITGISLVSAAWAYYRGVAISAYIAQQWNNRETLLGVVRLAAQRLGLISNTSAMLAQSAATKGAKIAQKGFNAAMLANPLGIVLGLIAAIVPWFVSLADSTNGATDALSALNKEMKTQADVQKAVSLSVSGAMNETKSKIKVLISLIENESSSLEIRKKAYEELIKISPSFKGTLDEEYRTTTRLTEAYTKYIDILEKAAKAKALQTLLSKSAEAMTDSSLKVFEAQKEREAKLNEIAEKEKEVDKLRPGVVRITKDIKNMFVDTFTLFKKNKVLKKAQEQYSSVFVKNKKIQEFINSQSEEMKKSIVESFSTIKDEGLKDEGLKDQGDKKGTTKYKGSKLSGSQKDKIMDFSAEKDYALAKAKERQMEGLISEEQYWEEYLAIYEKYAQKIQNFLRGNNAKERKINAEAYKQGVDQLSKAQDEILKIEEDKYNQQRRNLNTKNKENLDIIIKNETLTNTQRTAFLVSADTKYYQELERSYDAQIALLRSKNKSVIKLAEDRNAALETINARLRDYGKKLVTDSFSDLEVDNTRVDAMVKISSEEEKQAIYANEKLSAREKSYLIELQEITTSEALLQNRKYFLSQELALYAKKKESGELTQKETDLYNKINQELAEVNTKLEESIIRKKKLTSPEDENLFRSLEYMKDFLSKGFEDLGLGNVSAQFNTLFDTVLLSQEQFVKKYGENQERLTVAAIAGIQVVGQFAQKFTQESLNRRISMLDEELKASKSQSEGELAIIQSRLNFLNSFEEATEEQIAQRTALEDEYRVVKEQQLDKEKMIAIQKAKEEQRASAQQALINGGLAATVTLAQMGFLKGIPFALAALSFGVLQSALIMSRDPVPKYFKGTNFANEGLAITQEYGPEIITDKKGKIKTLGNRKGATKTWLDQGDRVYTSGETKKIIQALAENDSVGQNIFTKAASQQVILSPQILKSHINGDEIAEKIGTKFDKTMERYSNNTVYEIAGVQYLQKPGKFPEIVGKTKKGTINLINYVRN